MIFYTADLHFHYEPFLPSRPFDTVEDMDRQLIHRWNEAVSEEDTVYVVGDVGYTITGAWCPGTPYPGSGAIST